MRPPGPKSSKLSWQRFIRSKTARLVILGVGLVSMVSYAWLVTVMHPSFTNTEQSQELNGDGSKHLDTRSSPKSISLVQKLRQHAKRPDRREKAASSPPAGVEPPPPVPEPPRPLRNHPFSDAKYRIYKLPQQDTSPRCRASKICDGQYDCGPDGLGCITDDLKRKEAVRRAGAHTWMGYRKYAWGHDELNAGSKNMREWFRMGLTIVDSLDTLLILKLDEEYAEARNWVINHLDMNQGQVSVFETTIRILGGLSAAFYHSGGDEVYLEKAVEFATRLLPAFNTTSGVAQPQFDVRDKDIANTRAMSGSTCLAEIGTLSMEFTAVSRLSGRPEFRNKAMVFWDRLGSMPNSEGLYCTMLYGDSMSCNGNHYTFGAAADSTYEYMLKQWILTNGTDQHCLNFYHKALRAMRKHMLTELWMGDEIGSIWIAADLEGIGSKTLVLEHLTCFLPGTIALGHMYGVHTGEAGEEDDLMVAVKLMKGCYELYHQTASGVAWDSVWFHEAPAGGRRLMSFEDGELGGSSSNGSGGSSAGGGAGWGDALKGSSAAEGDTGSASSARRRLLRSDKRRYQFQPRSMENFLRPEVAEALFYLHRATGDPIYREWGWNMFRAYEKHSKVASGGYQCLADVDSASPRGTDKMESFWMAETMKYFYLLFSDDTAEVPLDEYVFNTEAHPLAIWGSKADQAATKQLAAFHQRVAAVQALAAKAAQPAASRV